MRRILFLLSLMILLPAYANEANHMLYTDHINMTPKQTYSGYTKSKDIKNKYMYSSSFEQQKKQMMKPKSVKDLSNFSDLDNRTNYPQSPMMFNQFPQQMTNEDMMHVNSIQNGIQNMYMNF